MFSFVSHWAALGPRHTPGSSCKSSNVVLAAVVIVVMVIAVIVVVIDTY